jgi:CYTH domain-containing protein
MIEIERKFLVISNDFIDQAFRKRIVQAYLNSNPERTVRVESKILKVLLL